MKRLLFAVVMLLGCATARPAPLSYERPQATLREAEALGAAEVPTARAHLKSAAEALEAARKLENSGDRNAALKLERASADADLALALAKEALVRRQTLRTASEVSSLKGEQP